MPHHNALAVTDGDYRSLIQHTLKRPRTV